MKNIELNHKPKGESISMRNLKLYGEIRNLHKRLTKNDV